MGPGAPLKIKGVSELLQFVLDFAPDGKFYIYQSYILQYSLEECLREHKAYTEDELMEKLELIASGTTSEHTPERDRAFCDLFHAKDPSFLTLDFFFIPVEYNKDAIPQVPNELSLT